MSEKDERLVELGAKIIQVCAYCAHGKWVGGKLNCDRKRSQCHSKRVRRWLDEIKRLEDEMPSDKGQTESGRPVP